MITIVLRGKEYKRDYQPNFCKLPGCGQRIQFKLSIKGVPESSDKYNARKGCCSAHSRAINRMNLNRSQMRVIVEVGSVDWFLCCLKPNVTVNPDGSVNYDGR